MPIPSCFGCPLMEVGQGFARANPVPGAKLLIVAESPSYADAINNRLLEDGLGYLLRRLLGWADIPYPLVRLTTLRSCYSSEYTKQDVKNEGTEHCKQYRDPVFTDFAKHGGRVLVPLGIEATKYCLGLEAQSDAGFNIKNFHGTVSRDRSDRFWVVPTFDLNDLMNISRKLMGVATWNLQVAKGLVEEDLERDPLDLVVDPSIEWLTAWVDEFLKVTRQGEHYLAVDIETPYKEKMEDESELTGEDQSYQILRINFSYQVSQGITFPWEGAYIEQARRLLASQVPKLFWNKRYDVPRILAAEG